MCIYNQLLDMSFDLWDGFVRVFGAMFNFALNFFVIHVQHLYLLYVWDYGLVCNHSNSCVKMNHYLTKKILTV